MPPSLAASSPVNRTDVLGSIADALSPALSPTGNGGAQRRALVGLAAARPDVALRLAHEMFGGEIPKKDPGVSAALVWGLAHLAETEPEAAAELLALADGGPVCDVAEAVLHVTRELGPGAFT